MNQIRTLVLCVAAVALAACSPKESRNIALHRAAYHSSAVDYNYTAQLVTDGIVESGLPLYYEVLETVPEADSLRTSPVPKHRKESPFQRRRGVHYKVPGPHYELTILERGIHFNADAVRLNLALRYKNDKEKGSPTAEIQATVDGGLHWDSVHRVDLRNLVPGKETVLEFGFAPDEIRNGYRLVLDGDEVSNWVLLEWDFFYQGEHQNLLGN